MRNSYRGLLLGFTTMLLLQALGMTEEELAACEADALQAADLHEQLHAWALQAVPERAAKECVAVANVCQ